MKKLPLTSFLMGLPILLTLSLTACEPLGNGYSSPYDDYSRPYDRGGYYDDRYDSRSEWDRARRERERAEDERREAERERRRAEEERRRREQEINSLPPPVWQRPAQQEHCPSGFSPSEQKCSPEERRRGCKDMRLPGGLGCVRR